MAFFDSFKPRLLQTLMAEGVTESGDRDTRKIRAGIERDQMREQERAEDMAERENYSSMRNAEQDRARRLEQIEGETSMQRQTRLQNQAWNPDRYGDKYRSQFNKNPLSPESAAAADEERRRKRLMMSRPDAEDEEY